MSTKIQELINKIEDPRHNNSYKCFLKTIRNIIGEPLNVLALIRIRIGTNQYKHQNGRAEGTFLADFMPQKRKTTLYSVVGFNKYLDLLSQLNQHKTGVYGLYLKQITNKSESSIRQLCHACACYFYSGYTKKRCLSRPD